MGWEEDLAAERAAPLDPRTVAAVVAGVYPGARVAGTRPLDGGLSSLSDVVELDGAPVRSVVLRRLPRVLGHDEAAARVEVAAQDVAASAGVIVPRVLWSDPTGTRFGAPAALMDFVAGRPIVPDLHRPAAAAAFVGAISSIHRVTPPATADLPLLRDLDAHVHRFGGALATSPVVDAVALARAVRGLASAFRPAAALVHGDLHGGNVLWDGRAVTGVLDWSGGGRGVPWWDEAYAVMDTTMAHGAGAGSELLAQLRARVGVPRPPDDVWGLWYGVALLRALPSPRGWVDAYTAMGCPIAPDELDARFVEEVTSWLARWG